MLRSLIFLVVLAGFAPAAWADYPDRPIRLIVGYAPGGSTDIVARLMADRMGARLGQTMLVENRGGAGGVAAAMIVLQQEADGYTLMLETNGLNQAAALGTRMPFDPVEAWAPIGLAAFGANALVVHPSVPARTMREFQALGRAASEPLRFGSPSVGLTSQLFAQGLGIEIEDIRYRGTSAALADLLAGRFQAYTIALAGILPHVQSGAIRALAIAGTRRSAVMPDLPTTAEQGFPDLVVASLFGLVSKAGTPAERITLLHATLNAVLAEPETTQRLFASGLEIDPSPDPAAFGRTIREDFERWDTVARRGNLRQ
ncbi:MAG: tripartite tricarboxylate transporter substrate binding protein [Rubritepida sp.]|nr:tripartite tricarboxylate transporter substrate binding protein [Rubritepida sp.]